MSLFAGTSFLSSANDKPEPAPVTAPSAPEPVEEPKIKPQPPTREEPKDVEPAPKPTTGTGHAAWSAALKFAPTASRRSKPNAPSSVKPSASIIASRLAPTSASFSSAPTIVAAPVIHAKDRVADAVLGDAGGEGQEGIDTSGRKIFKPPAMTLDQSEAFAHSTGRKRGAPGQGGGKKKKWRKNKKQFEIPQHVFIPDEPYNPSKPNDLQEYRDYRKSKREERKAQEREERERREREGSGKSWYSDDEDEYSEEEAPRRDAPRAFAPPSALYAASSDAPPPAPAVHSAASHVPQAAPVVIRKTETADEVYARRLAMSQATAGPSFVRPPPISIAPSFVKPTPGQAAGFVPQATAPTFQPSGFTTQVHQPSVFQPSGFTSQVHQPPSVFQPPLFQSSANPIDLTKDLPSPLPTVPAPPSGEEFQKTLEARRLAAETIAKRLAAQFGKQEPGIGAFEGVEERKEVDTSGMDAGDVVDLLAREVQRDAGVEEQGTFAERMMRKMGHVQGQGLGKSGTGIVHALAAEHVSDTKAGAKKPAAGKPGWTQSTSAKGRLVNLNQDAKQKEERERYGESSRVVCLVNVMASVDEADQEMMEDLGEKLKEHGIVERLVPHAVYPPPADPTEAVRIFVVFSGPAGAWKALKDLDARFFGGRKIAAKFFDEKRFEKGEWDGPILQ